MIKKPNVAGQFYSADPGELSADIDQLDRSVGKVSQDHRVEVLIAPHAGYVYSGPVAAFGFKAAARNSYTTIVVIAPSHHVPFEGISVWPHGAFQTPLGALSVDEDFAVRLLNENPQFKDMPQVFEREHALEVELPFIQKTFGDRLKIVPILMGQPDLKICLGLAAALDTLIGARKDVLIVVSSDMSHYHPYEEANRVDAGTLQAIAGVDPESLFKGCLSGGMEMCGFVPVTTALIYAKRRGLQHAEVLKYANSGDTAGDKSRVVGYSSVIFYTDDLVRQLSVEEGDVSAAQKKELVRIARLALESFVKTGQVGDVKVTDARLNQVQGAFVTLHKKGQLRGCIGNIIGREPLWKTAQDMAVAAASQDPRFSPVKSGELKDIDLEISVLSVPKRVKSAEEIVLGRDGVIVSDGGPHQGVFLPQVADETGWSKEQFLSELCSQKAGLSPDAWKDPRVQLFTFTADVFSE